MHEIIVVATWVLGVALIAAVVLLGFGSCRLVEAISNSIDELGAYNAVRRWGREFCVWAEFVGGLLLFVVVVVFVVALIAFIPWAVGTGGVRLWEWIT